MAEESYTHLADHRPTINEPSQADLDENTSPLGRFGIETLPAGTRLQTRRARRGAVLAIDRSQPTLFPRRIRLPAQQDAQQWLELIAGLYMKAGLEKNHEPILREPQAPDGFAGLDLDEIVAAVTTGHVDDHLETFFYAPLHEIPTVEYRHQVFHDLDRDETREPI